MFNESNLPTQENSESTEVDLSTGIEKMRSSTSIEELCETAIPLKEIIEHYGNTTEGVNPSYEHESQFDSMLQERFITLSKTDHTSAMEHIDDAPFFKTSLNLNLRNFLQEQGGEDIAAEVAEQGSLTEQTTEEKPGKASRENPFNSSGEFRDYLESPTNDQYPSSARRDILKEKDLIEDYDENEKSKLQLVFDTKASTTFKNELSENQDALGLTDDLIKKREGLILQEATDFEFFDENIKADLLQYLIKNKYEAQE